MTIVNTFHADYHTESSGTVITELFPPLNKSISDHTINEGVRTVLTSLSYVAAATEHDLVLMRAVAETTTTAASAASDTTLDVASATFVGQTVASGDYLCIQHADGTFGLYLASGLASLVITINAATKDINSGAKVWYFGSPTAEAAYHVTLKGLASTTNTFSDSLAGIVASGYDTGTYSRSGKGDPLAFYSSNSTNAGKLLYANGVYRRE
jgi:hypothetical protein